LRHPQATIAGVQTTRTIELGDGTQLQLQPHGDATTSVARWDGSERQPIDKLRDALSW
jgi:hypothetical protein